MRSKSDKLKLFLKFETSCFFSKIPKTKLFDIFYDLTTSAHSVLVDFVEIYKCMNMKYLYVYVYKVYVLKKYLFFISLYIRLLNIKT